MERGFVLVRGLRTEEYGDAMAAAIFFVMGLHLGQPIGQNQRGDLLDHVIATSNKTLSDKGALPSRVRDRLPFHSDSWTSSPSCACAAPRRVEPPAWSAEPRSTTRCSPLTDLRFLGLWTPVHLGLGDIEPDLQELTYTSPMIGLVDGVFSTYAGNSMIFSAQEYPGVPQLTPDQVAAINLFDEISQEPGLPIDMDFQPGDVQWLLNYAALHSRTSYVDHPEPVAPSAPAAPVAQAGRRPPAGSQVRQARRRVG
ncbi:hypothetical protein [Streptomyces afghaniensis 772] [Streptomyces afghaniensis]